MHYLTIARSNLIHVLGGDEKALGDKAYVGDSHFIAPYRPAITEEQREWNKCIDCVRNLRVHCLLDFDKQ